MGTETQNYQSYYRHQIHPLVKLNNPLMGTETALQSVVQTM